MNWLTGLSEKDGRTILARTVRLIICILLVELRNAFYVTVNRDGETLFYTHKKWKELESMHVELMGKGRCSYFVDLKS